MSSASLGDDRTAGDEPDVIEPEIVRFPLLEAVEEAAAQAHRGGHSQADIRAAATAGCARAADSEAES